MVNELKIICDLLDGYSFNEKFVVTEAEKIGIGWRLTVVNQASLEAKKEEVAEDDHE